MWEWRVFLPIAILKTITSTTKKNPISVVIFQESMRKEPFLLMHFLHSKHIKAKSHWQKSRMRNGQMEEKKICSYLQQPNPPADTLDVCCSSELIIRWKHQNIIWWWRWEPFKLTLLMKIKRNTSKQDQKLCSTRGNPAAGVLSHTLGLHLFSLPTDWKKINVFVLVRGRVAYTANNAIKNMRKCRQILGKVKHVHTAIISHVILHYHYDDWPQVPTIAVSSRWTGNKSFFQGYSQTQTSPAHINRYGTLSVGKGRVIHLLKFQFFQQYIVCMSMCRRGKRRRRTGKRSVILS